MTADTCDRRTKWLTAMSGSQSSDEKRAETTQDETTNTPEDDQAGFEHETAECPSKSSWLKTIYDVLIDQWFLLALGVLIAIASQVQVPLSQQKLKRTVTSYLCISIIFFVYDNHFTFLSQTRTDVQTAAPAPSSIPRPCFKTTADGNSTSSSKPNAS